MEEDKLKCEFNFEGSTITTSLTKIDFSESDLKEIIRRVRESDGIAFSNFVPSCPGNQTPKLHRRHFIFTLENSKKVHVEYSDSNSNYITIRIN